MSLRKPDPYVAGRLAELKAATKAAAEDRARRALALSLQAEEAARRRVHLKGEQVGNSVLTVPQVMCIRTMAAAKWAPSDIRRLMNLQVTVSTVCAVISRRSWPHV